MSIPMFLSYWDGKLTLSPHPEDERYVGLHKLSLNIEGRSVVFYHDEQNGHIGSSVSCEHNGSPWLQFAWTVGDQPWARFMRHEMQFDINGKGHFVMQLDADHVLPWPKLNGTQYTRTQLQEIAHREFEIRAKSAFEDGGGTEMSKFVKSVPDKIRQRIDRGFWMDTVNRLYMKEA